MNTFTAFFWKEWRNQRALLASYLSLAFLAFAAAWPLLPHGALVAQHEDEYGVGLFVIAALVGIVAFAAPQCVRGEIHGKDDMFLRRMPGALRAAFGAKMTFLALAGTIALPLGLLVGELALLLRGHAAVSLQSLSDYGPELNRILAIGLVSIPWVFAFALCLPSGRMAVGATAVFALIVMAALTAVYTSHPGLLLTHGLYGHLPWVGVVGLAVGYLACAHGRRGGGAWRATQFAAPACIVGFLPQVAILVAGVIEYRAVRPTSPGSAYSKAVSADGRFALAITKNRPQWPDVPWRVDLATGTAEPLAEPGVLVVPEGGWGRTPQERDLWIVHGATPFLFSLATGSRWQLAHDSSGDVIVPDDVRAAAGADLRALLPMRRADGRRVWLAAGAVELEEVDGRVTSVPWRRPFMPQQAGDAIMSSANGKTVAFDFERRAEVELPSSVEPWSRFVVVEGRWLLAPAAAGEKGAQWRTFDPATGHVAPCSGLTRLDHIVDVLGPGEVLLARRALNQPSRLFVWHAVDATVTELSMPAELRDSKRPWWVGSEYSRDRQHRLWVRASGGGKTEIMLLAVDPHTHTVDLMVHSPLLLEVRCFPDDHTLIADEDCNRIVRIDLVTKARTVLFPRAATAAPR
jgi:hypothetical protein